MNWDEWEEDDAPTFEKIIRQKPHREFEERLERKPKPSKHVSREDKE
jgi:hypothetical protein